MDFLFATHPKEEEMVTIKIACPCGTSVPVTPRLSVGEFWPTFDPYRCPSCHRILHPTTTEWTELLTALSGEHPVPEAWWRKHTGAPAPQPTT